MKYPNQYQGKNPIPGPKRYGNHKGDAARAEVGKADAAQPAAANADTSVAAAVTTALGGKPEAVVITQIDARPDPSVHAQPDPNVVTVAHAKAELASAPTVEVIATPQVDAKAAHSGTEARVDALAGVKSGAQILADTSKPAASTRPAS
jgi:hypothetical protein